MIGGHAISIGTLHHPLQTSLPEQSLEQAGRAPVAAVDGVRTLRSTAFS